MLHPGWSGERALHSQAETGVEIILADTGCCQWQNIAESENYPISDIYIQDGNRKLTQAPWPFSEGGQQCAEAMQQISQLSSALVNNSGHTGAQPAKE